MRKDVTILVSAAVAFAGTACNSEPSPPPPPAQWCEHDDTDLRVDSALCEQGFDGYEWEPDGDDHDGAIFNHRKTTTPRVAAPTKTTVKKTTTKPPVKKTTAAKKTTKAKK